MGLKWKSSEPLQLKNWPTLNHHATTFPWLALSIIHEAVSNSDRCSISIWKVFSVHWAVLSKLRRHKEPPLLLPVIGEVIDLIQSWKLGQPQQWKRMEKSFSQMISEMLTYIHVSRHSPALLWLSTTEAQMEKRKRRVLCGFLINGACRLFSWWFMLPFFTLVFEGHLPYTYTCAKLLPIYYACTSITLLKSFW